MNQQFAEIRCPRCGKLLGKGTFERGEVEFKCPRCNSYHTLRALRPCQERHERHQE